MADLDEILSGRNVDLPASERTLPDRGEDGRWVPTVEDAPESAPPAETPPETPPEAVKPEVKPAPEPVEDRVPQAALLDERRKRQQYERELADLRAQLQAKATPEPEAPEDFWSAPEKAVSAVAKREAAALEAKVSEMVGHIEANVSEKLARRQYPDYDQKRALFAERLESDPVLKAEMNRHLSSGGDLGEFVYGTATKLQQLSELGNIDAYKAKIEAEIRARIEADFAKRTPVPQSLNATPSPVTNSETWSGPPPLDAILKRR